MKNYKNLFFLVTVIFFMSCKKKDVTPGSYKSVRPTVDTTNIQGNYVNGGSTPIWSNNVIKNGINGTNWVLISYNDGFVTISKSDTIRFTTNNTYQIGNNATIDYKYVLYNTYGNSTINFNQFIPINGLYLSANNFSESMFKSTSIGNTISLRLKDNYSNVTYKAIFKRII